MWIVSSVAGVYKPYGGTTPACMWQRIYYRGAIGCPSGMILPKQTHGPHAGGCKKLREAADPGAPPGLFLKKTFFLNILTHFDEKSRFCSDFIVISQGSHVFKNFKHYVSLTFLIFIFLVEIFSGDILITSSFHEN